MNKDMIQEDEVDIDFFEMLQMLLKKWWLILIGGILGAIVMMVITAYLITPMYQSQAILYILSKGTSVTSFADIQIGTAVSEDLEIIATSKPVIDGAIKKIKAENNRTFTRQDINSMLSVINVEDTRILKIIATSDDPEVSCMVANAVAETTASQMAEIMKSDPPTMVEKAEAELNPISPSLVKNMVLGSAMMGFLVCLVLVLSFILNDNIKNEEQVRKYLGAPVLVTIPYISEKDRERAETKKSRRKKNKKEKNEN